MQREAYHYQVNGGKIVLLIEEWEDNDVGSRIMHVIIANRIAEYLSIEDKAPFLLGSIAPDNVN